MKKVVLVLLVAAYVFCILFVRIPAKSDANTTYLSCEEALTQYFQHPLIRTGVDGSLVSEYIYPANAEHGLFWCEQYVGSKTIIKLVQ